MNRPMFLDRLLSTFAAVSLTAVVVGAGVCAMSGVAAGLWGRNLAAWLVGALAAVALARWAGGRVILALAMAAPLGLAATLLDPGLEGVHRWLVAGPVRFNAAMLLLPALVVATATLAGRVGWWWVPAAVALAVLALQPDASQASALALAVCAIVVRLRSQNPMGRIALAVGAVAVAAVAWVRPDALQPVPEVEGIIQLAAAQSVLLAGAAVLLLLAFAAAPALATHGRDGDDARRAGLALTALLLAWIAAPALGAFPVPLVGIGLSPILGAWLGVGLLASLRRRGGSNAA